MTMGDISSELLANSDSPQELEEEVNSFPEWNPLEPLPEYARAWGLGIRRPTELPTGYDERIDPAHIFVFPKHPVTSIDKPYYVTALPCTYCAKIRQVCSRTRPHCQRCSVSGDPNRVCFYDVGYVKLPGPRLPKSRTRAADKDGADVSEKTSALAPVSSESDNLSQALQLVASSAHESSTPEPPYKRRRTSTSREVSVGTDNIAEPAPRGKGKAKVAGNSASQSIPAPKTRRVSRRIPVANSNLGSGTWEAADGTIWRSLRPNKAFTPLSIPGMPSGSSATHSRRQKPPESPRIWAASKEDLLAIFPELSKALDSNGSGIFKEEMALEPPLIFLEGNSWKDDHWGPEGVLELSIVREFTVPRGRGQNTDAFSIDFDLTNDTDQTMTLYDESTDVPTSGAETDPNRSHYIVCHPTALLKNKGIASPQSSSASQPPLPQYGIPQAVLPPYLTQRFALNAPWYGARLTGAFAMPASGNKNVQAFPRPVMPSTVAVGMHPQSHFPLQSNGAYISPMPPFPFLPFVAPSIPPALAPPPPLAPPTPLTPSVPPAPSIYSAPPAPPVPLAPPMPPNVLPNFIAPPTFPANGYAGQLPSFSPQARLTPSEEPMSPPLNDGIEPRLRPATFDDRPIRQRGPDSVSDDEADEPGEGPSLRAIIHEQMSSLGPIGSLSYDTSTPPPGTSTNFPTLRPAIIPTPSEAGQPPGLNGNSQRRPATRWNREVVVPTDLPPELQHMQECQTYGIPVSIVMAKDSVLLPFALEERVGVVYLGFFKIQGISHTIVSSVRSTTDGSLTARVRWRYKFKWIPGGDPVEADKPQPNHPWWANTPSDDSHADREPTPYSLLPLHLSSEFTKHGGHYGGGWSDVNARLGWHCMGCGRLNVQRQLCFQQCSTCGAGNGMVATGAMYVRDPHRMAPDSRPVDTYPEGVLCDIPDIEEDAMRTFVYTLRKGVTITHLFTCNRSIMQKYANQLFHDVQMQVPLIWQAAKTGFGFGPYFSYHVGTRHESGKTAISWEQVPECVKTIRSKIRSFATHEGRMKDFEISQMTILGWHTSGHRKGAGFSATHATIALLCLGADIELNIIPRGGYDENVHWEMDMYPQLSFDDVAGGDEEDTMDLLDLDGLPGDAKLANEGDIVDTDDEEDIPLAISTVRRREMAAAKQSESRVLRSASKFNSVASRALLAVDKPVSETKRLDKKVEPMFITLVHGDVLLLSGDEFEYTLHRTGMSVLVIGVGSAAKGTA